MPTPRFLQIHTLTSYPAVLLNRDDAGLAKRLPYGGATRTRVSSQSLKRHWRMANDVWSLSGIGAPMSVRSREVIERKVVPAIAQELPSTPHPVITAIGLELAKALYGTKAEDLSSRQALLLGWPEVRHLIATGIALARDETDPKTAATKAEKKLKEKETKLNLAALRESAALSAGLEAALFGRMVTSDVEANTDAPIHVAHAFTVHHEESETDYFTVVDDLKSREGGDDSGSAGIFDTELTSGLYYGYVVIDVPLLVSNLTGTEPDAWNKDGADRDLAARVVEHLLHLIATVTPGAKKGSTAPYAYSDLMLVEAGEHQPRSLAAAFRQPVPLAGRDDVAIRSVERLAERLKRHDQTYGTAEARRYLSLTDGGLPGAEGPLALDVLARWAGDTVRRAEA